MVSQAKFALSLAQLSPSLYLILNHHEQQKQQKQQLQQQKQKQQLYLSYYLPDLYHNSKLGFWDQ